MGGPQEEALRGLREGPGQGVASSPQLQAAQGVANDLQTRMPGGPKIRVVETTEEIASEYGRGWPANSCATGRKLSTIRAPTRWS